MPVGRNAIYWIATGLVVAAGCLSGFSYLAGTREVVEGFAHVGYPQQLRVMLGIAKAAGAVAIVAPGFPTIKEWAYAGFTFAWIAACVAHYLAGDGASALAPVALLVLLAVSYVTRPASRRWPAATRALV